MDTTQGSVVAIGEGVRIEGYGLAGVTLLGADSPARIRQRWRSLPARTTLVVLTAKAAAVLDAELHDSHDLLVAVMPP